ncbi:unnamed protein product [Closterium sp. Naga37s-1]|nr:unnamed protein product [Closterium sp. Naga37s-1]
MKLLIVAIAAVLLVSVALPTMAACAGESRTVRGHEYLVTNAPCGAAWNSDLISWSILCGCCETTPYAAKTPAFANEPSRPASTRNSAAGAAKWPNWRFGRTALRIRAYVSRASHRQLRAPVLPVLLQKSLHFPLC